MSILLISSPKAGNPVARSDHAIRRDRTTVRRRQGTCRARLGCAASSAFLIRAWPAFLLLSLSSCTYGGGELLYNLGFGRQNAIPAEFRLTHGRLLVLVDDVAEQVDWPPALNALFDDLTQALLRNNAAGKIIPPETIEAHRRTMPDFNKLSCREIGELVEAEQVLWVETKDFMAEEDYADIGAAAHWTVSVRVIDPRQKESRTLVRLWPTSPAGEIITASLGSGEVISLKTKDAISKALAADLAENIARRFYDYTPGDTERPPP